ncbi:hypothetical protein U8335_10260 [Roseiconus lacunae]|uniref:Secreted protein n=2 Tax=Roseiconus lacunae TaxID=2605694 RepID=A0ABT7PFY2_9BACT|nr:hypothetical protein [Roseiconus lacunae]MCD0460547.1 hypothetical protein [Roseiconus lacunae]MDM4015405.1 hypothetical protein [Roseiconus lacunae]WRQ52917.1 hypothetical protein U8335_10260 [Stieleria sp. HD01]
MKSFKLLSSLVCIMLGLFFAVGCEGDSEAQGPELGEIEQYLNDHPEEREDNPDDFEDEQDELSAGSE